MRVLSIFILTLLISINVFSQSDIQKRSEYWENKRLKSEGTVKAGKEDGRWIYYYQNGKKMMEGFYTNGVKTGKWNKYFDTGKKWFEGSYDESGHENGIWIFYSEENGAKIQEHDYATGRIITMYNTGEKMSEGIEKAGKKEGEWTTWHKNGKMESQGAFTNGKMTGKWRWAYENGSPQKEIDMENGKSLSWYKNGQKEFVHPIYLLKYYM